MKVCRVFLAILFLVIVADSSACQVEDPNKIVRDVADTWIVNKTDNVIAAMMGDMIRDQFPTVNPIPGLTIPETIIRGLKWSYSPISRSTKGYYKVTLTAEVPIYVRDNETQIDHLYSVSVDWILTVDALNSSVVSCMLDAGSFKWREM